MSPDTTWRRVKEILADAIERPAGERDAFLDSACSERRDVRERVESLLALERDAAGFLESPPGTIAPTDRPVELGRRIGGYRVVRVLGSGGMGIVYEAEQLHPQRLVALKVLRAGLASSEAMRRFEDEAQLLARLRHPGIAQVLEAGTHDDAPGPLAYFALELIPKARTILDHAREEALGTRARIDLFLEACAAVQHAHQHGVLHRDLKPANVLVDRTGQPKVIDFGIARALDRDRATLATTPGEILGTLAYMSPEQCAGDPADVDTRSDVYSLGVMLYELLTGRLPHDVRGRPIAEAARRIQEGEPERPSSIEPALRGDLETILLTAIERDRDRRYGSVADLAADLRRFLSREPIVARPPCVAHRVRLFALRNRALMGIVAVLAIAATIVITQSLRTARREAQQLTRSNEVRAFLKRMLTQANPERTNARDLTMRAVLDEAARRIDTDLASDPEAQREIHAITGDAYRGLGEYGQAEAHYREAMEIGRRIFPNDDLALADDLNRMAVVAFDETRLDEAEALFRRALAIRRSRSDASASSLATAVYGLARLLCAKQAFDEAEPLAREAIARYRDLHGSEHASTALALVNLGQVLQGKRDVAAAEACHREALATYRRVSGSESLDVAWSLEQLGRLLLSEGRLDEAEACLREALTTTRGILDDDHPTIVSVLDGLGVLRLARDDDEGAEVLLREALGIARRRFDGTNPTLTNVLGHLASTLIARESFEEAESLSRELIGLLPEGGAPRASASALLAHCLVHAGHFEEAESRLLEILATLRASPRESRETTRGAIGTLIELYATWGKPDEAARYRTMLESTSR